MKRTVEHVDWWVHITVVYNRGSEGEGEGLLICGLVSWGSIDSSKHFL